MKNQSLQALNKAVCGTSRYQLAQGSSFRTARRGISFLAGGTASPIRPSNSKLPERLAAAQQGPSYQLSLHHPLRDVSGRRTFSSTLRTNSGAQVTPTTVRLNIPGHGEHEWPNLWLRENCQCNRCIHPDTRQRLVDTFSLPPNIKPTSVEISSDKVEIKWNEEGHESSSFPVEWLISHRLQTPQVEVSSIKFRNDMEQVPLNPSRYPTVDYEEVMNSDEGVRKWTDNIYRWGFSLVDGSPATPEATEKLLERIAFIRHTHYGGFWDFTSDLSMKDMAYTTQELGAHTDTTYFTEPAGLQMFHVLSHTGGSGGASLLVDGFAAAQTLYREDPDAYNSLKTVLVNAHASGNEDVCIQPAAPFPILSHHPVTKELCRVQWNIEDRAARMDVDAATLVKWYDAARKFNEVLKRESMERWFQLKPGSPMIFDNWRMLHGRSEFTGKRRVCGAYINRDDFISRYLLLNKGREEVLGKI